MFGQIASVVPDTKEARAVGSLEPRHSRVARHAIEALSTKPTSNKMYVCRLDFPEAG